MRADTPSPKETREIGFYHPKAGDRVKVLVRYENVWRPIFWITVTRDGSVLLGPLKNDAKEMRKVKPHQVGQKLAIKFEDGQEVSSELIKSVHTSFHATGIINIKATGDRFFRDSFRAITAQQELCVLGFQHPGQFAGIQKIKRRDICLKYPFDEKCPLLLHVYVAPKNKLQIVQVPSVTYQLNLVLEYAKLKGVPALAVQLVLYHGFVAPWPEWTFLLFQTNASAASVS